MAETWTRDQCPHCGTFNWVNLGDMEEMIIPDVEAIECWSCDKHWAVCPEELDSMAGGGEALTVRGRESPDDPIVKPKKYMEINK